MRAGRFVRQPAGYTAFIPAPLPPDPPLLIDGEISRLLSEADRAVGRLDGVATMLPEHDLFVAMYVRQEAVLSSQIEGTQSTLDDVLKFELDSDGKELPKDVEEVVNYVHAMKYAIERAETLPLSLRLIREIHARLLRGVRGSERTPGEFRRSQNWIGPQGSTLQTAAFVPPPVHEMGTALCDLEKFLHDGSLPLLIHCGLVHAQFETIHPFLDGNGRVGRLLITFLLCQRQVLHHPLLYLSLFLKARRTEYYERLMAVRNDGSWEDWIKFFLRAVVDVARSAVQTARGILELRERHRQLVGEKMGARTGLGLQLLDQLYKRPLISVSVARDALECTFTTANKVVEEMASLGLLREVTGGRRNRRYRYDSYLALFDSLALPSSSATAAEKTDTKNAARKRRTRQS